LKSRLIRAQLQKALDVDAALPDNISPNVLKRGVAMVGGHAIAVAERAS
jgi:hypothetical protein